VKPGGYRWETVGERPDRGSTGFDLLIHAAVTVAAGVAVDSDRVAELEARVAEMELAVHRVYELEERLDFTEPTLTQARERESARLPGSPV
jgi:hypothetical protein